MKITPLWTKRLANERRVRARTPVFADNILYQVFHYDKGSFFESVMLALDCETGTEHWRTTVAHVANEPVVGPDGTIYLCSFEGSVLAYDRNGRLRWKAPAANRNMGVPCLAGSERLVVAEIGQGHRTWCLDAQSGAVLWTFDSGGFSYPIAATAETVVHATVVDGTRFGESTPHLFVMSADSGRCLWSTTYEQYLFMPVIVDDLVVVGARGALLAYYLADGRPAARLVLPPDAAVKVLVPLPDGFLLADDLGTIRRVVLSRKRSFFRSSVALVELWTTSFPNEMLGRPVVLGSMVLVLDKEGNLHILNIDDGSRVASHSRNGDTGAGGLTVWGARLAVANGRTLDVYRQSDLVIGQRPLKE
ncbi:outer membrane protein assembly factor BamB family protein [Neorhizobium alkalisoli]|uniref:outer membrane protein assembly factor BamB family protein n=1 Tax=Neorhizobium alkalisoli TaxID=528178 RepID=UPI000CF9A717|nr:PQQ-binding-like beta-propeller repeat protein [Neorhizobium alkalisoli]